MTGRNPLCAQHPGMIQKGFKFYFPVTHDIRIWRTPGAILVQEILEHIVPVLAGKINRV